MAAASGDRQGQVAPDLKLPDWVFERPSRRRGARRVREVLFGISRGSLRPNDRDKHLGGKSQPKASSK
jgi:hypothetical protein